MVRFAMVLDRGVRLEPIVRADSDRLSFANRAVQSSHCVTFPARFGGPAE